MCFGTGHQASEIMCGAAIRLALERGIDVRRAAQHQQQCPQGKPPAGVAFDAEIQRDAIASRSETSRIVAAFAIEASIEIMVQ
jgi:hypothetical protein